ALPDQPCSSDLSERSREEQDQRADDVHALSLAAIAYLARRRSTGSALVAGSNEAEVVCGDGGLGAVAHSKLVQDGCHVGLDGALADVERTGELGVGAALCDVTEDVLLALGQAA